MTDVPERDSVAEVVRKQAEVGIDVVSDGEFGKSISWSQYVLERLSGFERRPIKAGANPFMRGADREKFAEFYAELDARESVRDDGRKRYASGRSPIPARPNCSATSTISKRRSRASKSRRPSFRSPRRRASSPTARTNITRATRS